MYRIAGLEPGRYLVRVGSDKTNEILSFHAQDPTCSPPSRGLVAFYSGDGVLTNLVGGDGLTVSCCVQFGSGRVGQAFMLDGNSGYLAGPKATDNPFGLRDSSFAANSSGYAKRRPTEKGL